MPCKSTKRSPLTQSADREEAKKEEDEFDLNGDDLSDEEAEWGDQAEWQNEGETEDVKDESSAYLDFLNEEAQKLGAAIGEDDDDSDLDEESLMDTPLDQVDSYGLLKASLMRKRRAQSLPRLANLRIDMQSGQPQFYENLMKQLSPEEQQVLQSAVQHADQLAAEAQQKAQAEANGS